MKTLSPVLSQLINSVEQSGIAARPEQTGAHAFALNASEKAAQLMQRLADHKTHQAHANPQATMEDDAAMQAMLAMLLAQPATLSAPGQMQQADNPIVLHLTQHIQPAAQQNEALKQVLTGKTDRHPVTMGSASPALSAALQQALGQTDAPDEASLTPEQQSQLAVLRAREPKLLVQAAGPHTTLRPKSQPVTSPAVTAPHRLQAKAKLAERRMPAPVATAFDPVMATGPSKATGLTLETTAPVQVPMQPEEWAEKLTRLLKDRIHFQIDQQQQVSTIRLDPPSLGKLDIAIQLDAGKLTVHISASQPDVCRSLQQLSEQLRQQLTGQHFSQVAVNVSTGGGNERHQQQQHHQQQDDEILTARTLPTAQRVEQQRDPLLIKV